MAIPLDELDPTTTARDGSAKHSLQVAKNVFQLAKELPDPVKSAADTRADLRAIKLKTRRDTHKQLAVLYLIAIAFSLCPAEFQRFSHDDFFKAYTKKRPKADDSISRIMSALVRYAYDAPRSDSPGYHAAFRYSKKLARFVEDKLMPEAVVDRLENNNEFDEFGFSEPDPEEDWQKENRSGSAQKSKPTKQKGTKKGTAQDDKAGTEKTPCEKKVHFHMSSLRQKRISRRGVGSSFTALVERADDGTLCVRRLYFR